MFKFEKEQKIYDIGGVKVGGQPGQLPTVMIGSIFYHGDKIVEDEKKAVFNRQKAEEILNKEEELSRLTGNPRIIDVCGAWPEALPRFIEFVADSVKAPFLIDGTTAEVRVAGVKYIEEAGLTERAIYNSITPETSRQEINAIVDAKLKSAILLTMNPKKMTVNGRMDVIRGTGEKKGLIGLAQEAHIDNILVDTAVLDVPDPGSVAKTVYLIKKEFGLPAGCGPHNAVARWKERRKLDADKYQIAMALAHATPILMGANFILYGPISYAPKIYHACALADAYIAYSMRQEFGMSTLTKDHPLFKVFAT